MNEEVVPKNTKMATKFTVAVLMVSYLGEKSKHNALFTKLSSTKIAL